MSKTSDLMFLHAETPLHPGSGSALGAIDLPVARERHTQWPYIPASSLKGVLRDHCREKLGGEEKGSNLWTLFGPDTKNASEHAGALSISDSRLIAFPVRSLKGLFAWVTCPAALDRLLRDATMTAQDGLVGTVHALQAKTRDLNDDAALLASNAVIVGDKKIVLEEFDYTGNVVTEVTNLGKTLEQILGEGARLDSHLVVVSDNCFSHYVRFATEIMARIAIDYETKTVTDGALFYEEFIPAGAIFYSFVVAEGQRSKDKEKEESTRIPASKVMELLCDTVSERPFIQVGANSTTGKGICSVKLLGAGGEK